MEDFLKVSVSIYVNYVFLCGIFSTSEKLLSKWNYSLLKKYDTRVNRWLIFLLGECKSIHGRRIDKYNFEKKSERNYFYYTKKIYRYIMILGIPWFIVVYFMEWYLNKIFIAFHFFLINIPLIFLPDLILSSLIVLCDTKLLLYSKKERKDKKTKKKQN